MNWLLIEKFLSSGQAFIPVNVKDQGDSVKLYYQDNSSEIIDMPCKLFLSKLLYYFGTSVSVNRNRYGKLVGKRQLVPIILSYGITLVPYIVREPIGKQTRIGWLVGKEISGFQRRTKHTTSVQLSDHQIDVMHSEKFCIEQLKNARCIELCYGEIHEPHRRKWLFTAG
jgi:hypothetical protein